MSEMWAIVPRLLETNLYLVLATADADGVPWATPVFFAALDESHLFWVSSPESRHSRNIAERPTVAITVFDSQVPVGKAEAIYLEATAGTADASRRDVLLELLNTRLPPDKALAPADLLPDGPLAIYGAAVARHHVLVRGGDARFDNVVDARLEVAPPTPEETAAALLDAGPRQRQQ